MTEQMSTLIDGELDGFDENSLDACLRKICNDRDLRRDWALAHLIGDHLRGQRALSTTFTAALAQRLASEPTVLVPRPLEARQTPLWLALSVAASLLGVGLVCWVVLAMTSPQAFEVAIAPAARPAASQTALQTLQGVGRESLERPRISAPSLINARRQE
jgi:negative regulator of sigma E activity